jgi:hypothetical protein
LLVFPAIFLIKNIGLSRKKKVSTGYQLSFQTVSVAELKTPKYKSNMHLMTILVFESARVNIIWLAEPQCISTGKKIQFFF